MFSKINNITLLKNEQLSKHCSFKIGGKAKYFIYAHNIDALLDTLHTCQQHSINYKIIGNGSNMLFDDLGYNGTIIKYDNNFKLLKNGILQASSGCALPELIQFTKTHNLGGFEFAIGVPAMIGGAITNNLGAYNNEISTHIKQITILENNHLKYLTKNECAFSYHCSSFQKSNSIILGASFLLPHQDKNVTQLKCTEYFTKRKNAQPLNLPNAGSIFKRFNNVIPAKLIDEAGLKGLTIGNAQISTKHSGFIVNLSNAQSKDVLKLIEIIKNKIYEKYNIVLQEEIEYLPYK